MAKSTSSQRWLQEHFKDKFVKKAQKSGWRSRASYKLLEIQKKNNIFKPNSNVVDLGAAPGGWSQVVANFVGSKGVIIASDILEMKPIAGVTFIQGDFTTDTVFDRIISIIGDKAIDLVISDMAPNMSGMKDIDQARAIGLAEIALDFANLVLKDKGDFLIKVFHGAGFNNFSSLLKQQFDKVTVHKPDASRSRSSEIYLLARGYNK